MYINPSAFESVRTAVLKIRWEHPDARFSFDLSAGSKDLAMAFFVISLWLEGDAPDGVAVRDRVDAKGTEG